MTEYDGRNGWEQFAEVSSEVFMPSGEDFSWDYWRGYYMCLSKDEWYSAMWEVCTEMDNGETCPLLKDWTLQKDHEYEKQWLYNNLRLSK